MEPFHQYISEYKNQVQKGAIPKAYRGLMDYILDLRAHFQKKYPDYFVSGSIYFGYMDMTYFAVQSKSLAKRKLKIAVVFIHESVRFEVWLSAQNQQVLTKYWQVIKESNWNKYQLVPTTKIKFADSILEHVLVGAPDFRDLDKLTKQIEKETLKFIQDVEGFLSKTK